MKIEQLKLENFKCFKTEKTFDFARITILTGANSSGKSTVMQAILSAIQSDGFPTNFSSNGEYVEMGDFEEITYNSNANPFKLSFKFDDRILKTSWSKDLRYFLPTLQIMTLTTNDNPNIKIEKTDKEIYSFLFIRSELGEAKHVYNFLKGEGYLNKFSMKGEYSEHQLKLLSTFDNFYKLCSEINSYPIENKEVIYFFNDILPYLDDSFWKIFYEKMNYISPFRQPPARTYLARNKRNLKIGIGGEGFIDQIIKWEKLSDVKIKTLVEVMNEMDLFEAIEIKRASGGRFEMLVRPTNSIALTSLSNVGFGVSQFLPIIIADLQLPDDSTLFLAEPEIHLHPSVQSKFGQYIVNQVNTTDKNYIIETHSEYFLNRIRLAIVKGELKKSDVKIYMT
ncbi:MAG: hypothetical protein RIS64_2844 [Bacteroidota bacterium]